MRNPIFNFQVLLSIIQNFMNFIFYLNGKKTNLSRKLKVSINSPTFVRILLNYHCTQTNVI